jgi:hypothetical protein
MRLLKIESLPDTKQWVDRDEIMLHACFQILKDFIEKENGDTHCNYEAHKDRIDEIRFLNNWWADRCKREVFKVDYEIEDNEMLSRLMKIRLFLWT